MPPPPPPPPGREGVEAEDHGEQEHQEEGGDGHHDEVVGRVEHQREPQVDAHGQGQRRVDGRLQGVPPPRAQPTPVVRDGVGLRAFVSSVWFVCKYLYLGETAVGWCLVVGVWWLMGQRCCAAAVCTHSAQSPTDLHHVVQPHAEDEQPADDGGHQEREPRHDDGGDEAHRVGLVVDQDAQEAPAAVGGLWIGGLGGGGP